LILPQGLPVAGADSVPPWSAWPWAWTWVVAVASGRGHRLRSCPKACLSPARPAFRPGRLGRWLPGAGLGPGLWLPARGHRLRSCPKACRSPARPAFHPGRLGRWLPGAGLGLGLGPRSCHKACQPPTRPAVRPWPGLAASNTRRGLPALTSL